MTERDLHDDNLRMQRRWHGWASPVGLGIGVLTMTGAFALLALGISILSSI